jgi:hypothetical protein
MPRRSRREETPARRRHGKRDPPPAAVAEIAARIAGAPALGRDGYEVRTTTGERRYRCPYCQGPVEPGLSHVVAFPAGQPEDRRHYHSGCWVKVRGSLR